jgi:hypothetical protein
MSRAEVNEAIGRGGRFVFFETCISCVLFTLRRPTEIVFLPAEHSGWVRGLPYTLVSVVFGWWGLPWGIICTPLVLANNLAGGCDVTAQICAYLDAVERATGLVPVVRVPEVPPCDLD